MEGLFKVIWIFENINNVKWIASVVGLSSLIILYSIKFCKSKLGHRPKFKWLIYVPEILIVVIYGIVLTDIASLDRKGLEVLGMNKGGLPTPAFPNISPDRISSLLQPALVISIVGFVEANIGAKLFATKHGYSVSSNRELVALGLANIFGSCFGAFPCFASLPRSLVNDRTGARSNFSILFSCIVIAMALLFLLPYFELLPKAVMASIIIVAASNLIEFEDMKFLVQVRDWISLGLVIVMILITFILGIESGIFASLIISIFLIVKMATTPFITIRRRVQDEKKFHDYKIFKDLNIFDEKHGWFSSNDLLSNQGVLIIRIESALYFANIGTVITKKKISFIIHISSLKKFFSLNLY